MPTQHDLFSAFLSAAKKHGWDKQVLEDISGTRLSYRRLLEASLACATWTSRYSAPRETVGVLLPNINITVAMLLGLASARRVPAMLDYTAGAAGVASACALARITMVVSSRRFLDTLKLQDIARKLHGIRIMYVEDMPQTLGWLHKARIKIRAMLPSLYTAAAPDQPALVMFTSGSEAQPKGIVLSHAAILANMAQLDQVIDFNAQDRFLATLPLHHAYGLTVCTLLPLLHGAHICLHTSPLHYDTIPKLAQSWRATCLFGTSSFLYHYARHARPDDFRSVRHVIAGGEKLSKEVRAMWEEKFGLRILEGYGATECAPVISVNTPLAHRVGSVGRLLPGIEHRIEAVPGIDEGGVLHLRGPNLMLGYYLHDHPGKLQPPASVYGNGWYNTGDVVAIDSDGYLTIKGRIKRFAKIGGEMVSLEMAERIAQHAAPQHQHAAALKSDIGRGETIVLFTTAPALDRLTLTRAARDLGYPELAIARHCVHVDALPLLAIGKVDYTELKKQAQQLPVRPSPDMG